MLEILKDQCGIEKHGTKMATHAGQLSQCHLLRRHLDMSLYRESDNI